MSGRGEADPGLRAQAAVALLPYAYAKNAARAAPHFLEPFDIGSCNTSAEVAAASSRVLIEVTAGRLDLNEGERLSNLLENRRKCIETADLEKRILAIEAARVS